MRIARQWLAAGLVLAGAMACAPAQTARDKNENAMQNNTMKLAVKGGKTFTARLADNPSAEALRALLKEGELTIEMRDYAHMEKVGALGRDLPRSDAPIAAVAGDLILYQGRHFVICYAPNSWSLTRLGKIEGADAEALLSALGRGDVTVILSIND